MPFMRQNLHFDSLCTPVPYPDLQTSLYRRLGVYFGKSNSSHSAFLKSIHNL